MTDEKKKEEQRKKLEIAYPWAFETAKEAIRDFMEYHSPLPAYTENCMANIKTLFMRTYQTKYYGRKRASQEETNEATKVWRLFEPYFLELVNKKAFDYSKRIKRREIRIATVTAILEDVLKDIGDSWTMETQSYRARLWVNLGNGRGLTFYANYKRLIKDECFAQQVHDFIIRMRAESTAFGAFTVK